MTRTLLLGTRSSALALTQSGHIADALRALGAKVKLVPLVTPGDADSRPLRGRANEGIFVSSVRDALLRGTIDFAVHSLKDVPLEPVAGLVLAAVPVREDPCDTLISKHPGIAHLAPGAVVGTCSVRRAAWVHRVRPDLVVSSIRGHIDQRIARVQSGEFDAIILAAAGLNRLRCTTSGRQDLSVKDLVPAPAQGALAIECRPDDEIRIHLKQLEHPDIRQAVTAERAVLAAIDPTDSTAVGAIAKVESGRLILLADISRPNGSGRIVVNSDVAYVPGTEGLRIAHRLGTAVAAQLFAGSTSWKTVRAS